MGGSPQRDKSPRRTRLSPRCHSPARPPKPHTMAWRTRGSATPAHMACRETRLHEGRRWLLDVFDADALPDRTLTCCADSNGSPIRGATIAISLHPNSNSNTSQAHSEQPVPSHPAQPRPNTYLPTYPPPRRPPRLRLFPTAHPSQPRACPWGKNLRISSAPAASGNASLAARLDRLGVGR